MTVPGHGFDNRRNRCPAFAGSVILIRNFVHGAVVISGLNVPDRAVASARTEIHMSCAIAGVGHSQQRKPDYNHCWKRITIILTHRRKGRGGEAAVGGRLPGRVMIIG